MQKAADRRGGAFANAADFLFPVIEKWPW